MLDTQAFHPELNLPYGKWIVIGRQNFTGALWQYNFDWSTMRAIDALLDAQQAWIMLRRVFEGNKPTVMFERLLWLQTPEFQAWRGRRR